MRDGNAKIEFLPIHQFLNRKQQAHRIGTARDGNYDSVVFERQPKPSPFSDQAANEFVHESYYVSIDFRAAARASATRSGEVPPVADLAASVRSIPSTSKTSSSICSENCRNSSMESSCNSRFCSAAKRTALPTASWAVRNAMPFRTR